MAHATRTPLSVSLMMRSIWPIATSTGTVEGASGSSGATSSMSAGMLRPRREDSNCDFDATLTPNFDATFTPDIVSNKSTSAEGSRWRHLRRFRSLAVTDIGLSTKWGRSFSSASTQPFMQSAIPPEARPFSLAETLTRTSAGWRRRYPELRTWLTKARSSRRGKAGIPPTAA